MLLISIPVCRMSLILDFFFCEIEKSFVISLPVAMRLIKSHEKLVLCLKLCTVDLIIVHLTVCYEQHIIESNWNVLYNTKRNIDLQLTVRSEFKLESNPRIYYNDRPRHLYLLSFEVMNRFIGNIRIKRSFFRIHRCINSYICTPNLKH